MPYLVEDNKCLKEIGIIVVEKNLIFDVNGSGDREFEVEGTEGLEKDYDLMSVSFENEPGENYLSINANGYSWKNGKLNINIRWQSTQNNAHSTMRCFLIKK